MRTPKRGLGSNDARLQLLEIERTRRGSRRQREILRRRAARGREHTSRGTRLLQRVEKGELADREIGRAGMLEAPRRPGRKAQPGPLREIDDARFDVARRRLGRQGAAGGRHTVHEVQRRERELAQWKRSRLEHRPALARALERAAHVGEIAEQLPCPGVERRLGPRHRRRARGTGRAAPQQQYPMGHGGAAPRDACDFELGSGRVSLSDRRKRRGGSSGIAARHLVGNLRGERIAQAVDGIGEPVELATKTGELVRGRTHRLQGVRHLALCIVPFRGQRESIDDVVGRDLLDGQVGGFEPAGRQRREIAQGSDETIEPEVVQTALEAVTEERAERLALARAVDQPRGLARAARGEFDRKRTVRRRDAGRAQVSVSQQRGGRGVRRRWGVNESGVVRRSRERRRFAGRRRHGHHGRRRHRMQVLDPPVAARPQPDGVLGSQRRKPLGREGRDPGIEPMRREVERALHQQLQRLAVAPLQALEARAKIREGGELGGSRRNGNPSKRILDDLPDRAIAGDRRDLRLQLTLEGLRKPTASDQIVELRIARAAARHCPPAPARRPGPPLRRSRAAARGARASAAGSCSRPSRRRPAAPRSRHRCEAPRATPRCNRARAASTATPRRLARGRT